MVVHDYFGGSLVMGEVVVEGEEVDVTLGQFDLHELVVGGIAGAGRGRTSGSGRIR